MQIKVLAHRPRGVNDCAVDRKLSAYGIGYYFTFLHEEAARALKAHLDTRREDGWGPKDRDPVFVTEGTTSQGKPITALHLIEVVKNLAKQIGIEPDTIWTHCLRKSFRKQLYRAGVDNDLAEALMGHKLAGSKGSYFDFKDVEFVEKAYLSAFWSRISLSRITHLEEQVGELRDLRAEVAALRAENAELLEQKKTIQGLTTLVHRLEQMLHARPPPKTEAQEPSKASAS